MEAKSAARERFESAKDSLVELSHRINAHPELGFLAMAWTCIDLATGKREGGCA